MNSKITEKIILFILLISAMTAIYVAVNRHSIESSNKNVEIVMDYTSFYNMVTSEGIDEYEVAKMYKDAGLSGFAFLEDTIDSLKQQGYIEWYSGNEAYRRFKDLKLEFSSDKTYLAVYNKETERELFAYLPFITPVSHLLRKAEDPSLEAPSIFELAIQTTDLQYAGVGFAPSKLNAYKQLGFDIVVRPENKKKRGNALINNYFDLISNIGSVDTIIFAGSDNDVLGYPDYLPATASSIKLHALTYGILEAPNVKAAQKGMQTLSEKLPEQAIRAMAVPPVQQVRLTIDGMAEKYALGVRERNIRLIYLRPHTIFKDDKDIIQTNYDYIVAVAQAIKDAGFEIGTAEPFKPYMPNTLQLLILGVVPLLLLIMLLKKKEIDGTGWNLALVVLWCLFTILLFNVDRVTAWRKLSALGAAILTPIAIFHYAFAYIKALIKKMSLKEAWLKSSALFIVMLICHIIGGLIVAGLLSDNAFFTQIDMFKGIKAILILPPIAILLLWFTEKNSIIETLKNAADKVVKFIHVAILFIISGMGGYYLLRSGNAGEWAVSSSELSFRSFLNRVLPVRPRFKEFLLAFPAMMLFPALAQLNIEKYAWVLLLLGSIGFADLLDTFAHLHTPILITLIRVLLSATLGWVIGSIILTLTYIKRGKGDKNEQQ